MWSCQCLHRGILFKTVDCTNGAITLCLNDPLWLSSLARDFFGLSGRRTRGKRAYQLKYFFEINKRDGEIKGLYVVNKKQMSKISWATVPLRTVLLSYWQIMFRNDRRKATGIFCVGCCQMHWLFLWVSDSFVYF
jgi:hypothetical protein